VCGWQLQLQLRQDALPLFALYNQNQTKIRKKNKRYWKRGTVHTPVGKNNKNGKQNTNRTERTEQSQQQQHSALAAARLNRRTRDFKMPDFVVARRKETE